MAGRIWPFQARSVFPADRGRNSATLCYNCAMKRNFVLAGLLLALAMLASAADVAGKWQGSFSFNDQAVPLTFELKGATEITGTVAGLPAGVAEIKEGKLEGENLSFFIMTEYEGNPIKLVYRGKVSSEEIKFEFGTEDGSWGTQLVAKRA